MRIIYDNLVEFSEVAIRCHQTEIEDKCMYCPFYDRCKIDEVENRSIMCGTIEQQPKGE